MKDIKIGRALSLVVAALLCVTAMAVPAKRGVRRVVTLEDGTSREVELRGDENMHFYAGVSDGEFYVKGKGNRYVKADKALVTARWTSRLKARNERRINRLRKQQERASQMQATASTRSVQSASGTFTGKKKGLVLLVNFQDKSLNTAHGQAYYDNFFNQTGFAKDDMAGSVHDYFFDSSYGKLDLTFDVYGPFTLSRSMEYYGKNDSAGDDMHPAEMVIEACKKADQAGVDFSRYDWDGDGWVDQVFVIYAGYAEAQGASANTIWPHEWDLASAKYGGDGTGVQTFDGVKVNTYAVSCELSGSYGTRVDGIGTACHEFSHCLGLSDLYDTSGGNAFGLGCWDLMDSGSYLGARAGGECPCAYSSFERMMCGWLQPVELQHGCLVEEMACLKDAPEAYILYNGAKETEFYLLENRQKKGFDAYLPGHGMLITHVDFDNKAWRDNQMNSVASHQRITLIPADNALSGNNLAGDTWPGTSHNTSLTDTSRPAAKLYNANLDGRKYMGKPIEDITENTQRGTISFRFDGGARLAVPTGVKVDELDADELSFSVSWPPVEQADYYELKVTEVDATEALLESSRRLTETFRKFASGTENTLMTGADVSQKLGVYMDTFGWTGEKLFFDPNGRMRLGNSSSGGRLVSPLLTAGQGDVTILLECSAYNSDASSLGVMINSSLLKTIPLTAQSEMYVLHARVNEPFRLTLYTENRSGRAYISGISVFEGRFEEADLKAALSDDKVQNTWQIKTTNNSCYLEDLSRGCCYDVWVRAVSDSGYSDWSAPLRVDWQSGVGEVFSTTYSRNACDVRTFDVLGRIVRADRQRGLYIRGGKKYVK